MRQLAKNEAFGAPRPDSVQLARFLTIKGVHHLGAPMRAGTIPRYKWILAAGDYLCIVSSYVIAMLVLPGKIDVLNWSNNLSFAAFALVWVFAMEIYNLYQHNVVMNRSEQTVLLVKSTMTAFMVAILTDYLFRPDNWIGSRAVNACVYPSGILLLGAWRMLIFRRLWLSTSFAPRYSQRIAIIGASQRGLNIASRIQLRKNADVELVGFVEEPNSAQAEVVKAEQAPAYKILGTRRDVRAIAAQHNIHRFVIASDELAAGEMLDIAEQCTSVGAQVDVASASSGILNQRGTPIPDLEFPVIHFHGSYNNLGARILKRVADIVLSSLGLVLLSPVFAVLAALVKLSSKGPVFYKSRRVGRFGHMFDFYKFRSMRPATENHDAHVLKEQYESYIKSNQAVGKIINDDRVTAIGKVMRKTSLDELPQLWNVLKGDMSIVGPRPCLAHEYQLYDEWHKKRVSVLPGCTGLWQVSDRKKTSFNDMVMLDYYYIENMSLWFDIQIILKTIPVMLFGRGDF